MERSFYVRWDREAGPLFSTDNSDWKPLTEIATGNIGFALGIADEGPFATLSLHATERS